MEDFGFRNGLSIGDSCWRVNNNNNNLLDSNSASVDATKKFQNDMLLEDKIQQAKQRDVVSATFDVNAGGGCNGQSRGGGSGGSVLGDGVVKGGKQTASTSAATTTTVATAYGIAATVTPTYVSRIEDEGGGFSSSCFVGGCGGGAGIGVGCGTTAGVEKADKQVNGCTNTTTYASYTLGNYGSLTTPAAATAAGAAITSLASALPVLGCDLDTYGLAAAALSPTDTAAAALGIGGGPNSNRTSMNNSTENLSYSSDNYYPDDLILLDDDDDVEAEEISLNSDDCVYAYRGGGDGADFELAAFDANLGRIGIGALDIGDAADDETEFLEMDFEPDPLSEADFMSLSCAGAEQAQGLFLMQRDLCQLSGRHSANMSLQDVTPAVAAAQRQHFSSPIDDLPPQEALQTQAQRLNKNFARINLHLDQIKGGNADDAIDDDDEAGGGGVQHSLNKRISNDSLSIGQAAHSLPNTLFPTNFGRTDIVDVPQTATSAMEHRSPSKVTGAKPKRLSTFSTSSSVSSKNSSSKSRNSLRNSAFAPAALGNSASFDERSVSCNDFRSSIVGIGSSGGLTTNTTSDVDCAPMLAVAAAAVVAATAVAAAAASNACNFDLSTNSEENCLDCLEKEFLASTIGKEMDMNSCSKCANKKRNLSIYTRAEQSRCHSDSPGYFLGLRDEGLFSTSNMPTPRKRSSDWLMPAATSAPSRQWELCTSSVDNQRGTMCDNRSGMQLLKQTVCSEPAQSQLSTAEISETTLVQALDRLSVTYNSELIKSYFQQLDEADQRQECSHIYNNLKDFLLHTSKRNCNHHKLKKLIEEATDQVEVLFKEHTSLTGGECEMVQVKTAHILTHWERNKDISALRTMERRFRDANVLGKVANLIRQAHQRNESSPGSSTRRPMPDFILIPQYYQRGELTLVRKC